MKNMQAIVNDPELWEQFVIAYRIAGRYRPKVQFRRMIINLSSMVIMDNYIWCYSKDYTGPMLLAETGFIHKDLKDWSIWD